jgi:hypothetical protein
MNITRKLTLKDFVKLSILTEALDNYARFYFALYPHAAIGPALSKLQVLLGGKELFITLRSYDDDYVEIGLLKNAFDIMVKHIMLYTNNLSEFETVSAKNGEAPPDEITSFNDIANIISILFNWRKTTPEIWAQNEFNSYMEQLPYIKELEIKKSAGQPISPSAEAQVANFKQHFFNPNK